MAISNFIPEVWSAAILETLRSKLVFGSLCNRDYEGDIAEAGDTVHITGITDITVKTYDRTAEIDIEAASDKDAGTLNIDQSDYFAFYVGDLDAVQAKGNLTGTFTNSAAYGMAKKVDTYIAGLMDKAISKETAKINVKPPPTPTPRSWRPDRLSTRPTCPTKDAGSRSARHSTRCCSKTPCSFPAPNPDTPRSSTASSARSTA